MDIPKPLNQSIPGTVNVRNNHQIFLTIFQRRINPHCLLRQSPLGFQNHHPHPLRSDTPSLDRYIPTMEIHLSKDNESNEIEITTFHRPAEGKKQKHPTHRPDSSFPPTIFPSPLPLHFAGSQEGPLFRYRHLAIFDWYITFVTTKSTNQVSEFLYSANLCREVYSLLTVKPLDLRRCGTNMVLFVDVH